MDTAWPQIEQASRDMGMNRTSMPILEFGVHPIMRKGEKLSNPEDDRQKMRVVRNDTLISDDHKNEKPRKLCRGHPPPCVPKTVPSCNGGVVKW